MNDSSDYAGTIGAIRAPQAHGTAVVYPCGDELVRLARFNVECGINVDAELGTWSLADVRPMARGTLLELAQRYTLAYSAPGSLPATHLDGPIIVSGHQPEFFHAGVWFKNFVAAEIAARTGGVAIHLLTDQDVMRQGTLRVPTRDAGQAGIATVPFDRPMGAVPLEEWRVEDLDLWRDFGTRVAEKLEPFATRPMIQTAWPHVFANYQESGNAARALAQARHAIEQRLGLRTLELPLSSLCRTEAYSIFAAAVLKDLPQFHDRFHAHLADYRREHRVRGKGHPFPALERSDDWYEAPFWIWTADRPERTAAWLGCKGGHATLVSGDPRRGTSETSQWSLPCHDFSALVEGLVRLEQEGVRLRPRAITLTMYVRLLLCDLFVHGIGGAKYDRLTDRVAADLFGVELPRYAVATATIRFPLECPDPDPRQVGSLRQAWRVRHFHPEAHLSSVTAQEARWMDEKREWIGRQARSELPRRHREIEERNRRLRARLLPEMTQIEAQSSLLRTRRSLLEFLASREHPFWFENEEKLGPQLLDLARRSA